MSTSYIIRTCNSDFTSHNGFRWPALGEVVCPDFDAAKECGAGLFGFLNGCGKGWLAAWSGKPQWLLVAVPSDTIIDFGDKVKFPSGEVVFSSQDQLAVIAELERLNPETKHMDVIGRPLPPLKQPTFKQVRHEYNERRRIEFLQKMNAKGYRGTSTSGELDTSNSGCFGRSASRHNGTSTSGDYGTSVSGMRGASIVGIHGKAKSGLGGHLIFSYADNGTKKFASFLVDGKTVKADTFYKYDGKLVKVL
jgi:hypothetical protein